jgi:hypothetical protein
MSRRHGLGLAEEADDKFKTLFQPLPGGRGIAGVSIYSPTDIEVRRIFQNEWFNKRNADSRTMRQAGCGKL